MEEEKDIFEVDDKANLKKLKDLFAMIGGNTMLGGRISNLTARGDHLVPSLSLRGALQSTSLPWEFLSFLKP